MATTARPQDAWRPLFGAVPSSGGTLVTVWAPTATRVEVLIERDKGREAHDLEPVGSGLFSRTLDRLVTGDRYWLRVDAAGPFPDPASRYQPQGVHGPSEVVDPTTFQWTDASWGGVGIEDLVLYEMHVGTFTPEGTFDSAAERLPYLRDLGITAVELMPVADFAGNRNWGYDGVALSAPARCYGRPDDLRRLVDRAHSLGLAVHLDVVYNHLGPDGAYLPQVSTLFFHPSSSSPWGQAVNLDGGGSEWVRRFLIDSAQHWIHEYHLDGLRLDATHALIDESPRHFVADLAHDVHAGAVGRRALVIAEDHRNLADMIRPEAEGGWGLDGAWADDFHHQTRRLLANDTDGYFEDFTGSVEDLATTIRQGWFYTGQYSAHFGAPRGSDPSGLPPSRFVICLQNHDQVGNRAFGDRLHHQVDAAAWRAATALLLVAPATPLLFMGQEWAASTPFQYFTDHHEELGRLVREGRRHEFRTFAAFSDPERRKAIPDPQAPATFERSRLRWSEPGANPHAAVLRLYRRLLGLRRQHPALAARAPCVVATIGADTLVLGRRGDGASLLTVIRLRGAGPVALAANSVEPGPWTPLLTTEDSDYAVDPASAAVHETAKGLTIEFRRPGAVLLERRP